MSLDITINPLSINLTKAQDDLTAQIVIVTGIPFPIEDPSTGGPLHVPSDQYRVPLDKTSARGLGEALIELSNDLKEHSNIQIANSLQGVEQAVNLDKNLRS